MKIRKATKKDLKKCAKISDIPELVLDYYGKRPNVNHLAEFLGPLFLVVEDSGNIIGYILGEKEKAGVVFLNILVVEKKFRDKGIGKLLLKEFMKRAKKMKLKEVYTLAPNWKKKLLKFYKKNGFFEMKYYTYFTKDL